MTDGAKEECRRWVYRQDEGPLGDERVADAFSNSDI